jgi:transposase
MRRPTVKYTFKQFQAQFPDDAACLLSIMNIQYGGTLIHCPTCGVETQFHAMSGRRAFAGQDCGHHIYPCADTIFHKSSTKLTHWLFAMYLMTSTRHGVAAKELERQIGCTYKTAWRMAHELRKLMASADTHGQGPLSGHVEIDETLIGGKVKGHAHMMSNKTELLGMVQRDGRIIAGPIPSRKAFVLERAVERNVAKGAVVSTDEWPAYGNLGPMGYTHGTVNHSKDEWVSGVHHTNSIEGHWSQLKRSIRGTHVHVSKKHLWKYVSEFSYRRNNRHSHRAMFDRMFCAISLPRLAET